MAGIASFTPDQLAALESDLRAGELSWRQLEAKYGAAQSSLRAHARRHAIQRGRPAAQRILGAALAGADTDDDLPATASKIAALSLRRIHAEMAALVAPGAAALDPRNLKLLLEGAALALELDARAKNMDMPTDMENLTDAQLDALAAGRPWRNVA